MKAWIVCLVGMVMTGCASGPKLDLNALAPHFYGQPERVVTYRVTGVTEYILRGENMTIEHAQPKNPLSMIQQSSQATEILQTATRTALGAFGIYTAGQSIDTLSKQPRTVDPVIVQPQVVTVPAGP
jgi:hypothetical protein